MPRIKREREITHPPNERAIMPFEMLSPGDADYTVFINRWLDREQKDLSTKTSHERKKGKKK